MYGSIDILSLFLTYCICHVSLVLTIGRVDCILRSSLEWGFSAETTYLYFEAMLLLESLAGIIIAIIWDCYPEPLSPPATCRRTLWTGKRTRMPCLKLCPAHCTSSHASGTSSESLLWTNSANVPREASCHRVQIFQPASAQIHKRTMLRQLCLN